MNLSKNDFVTHMNQDQLYNELTGKFYLIANRLELI